jgi:hypothetical protein
VQSMATRAHIQASASAAAAPSNRRRPRLARRGLPGTRAGPRPPPSTGNPSFVLLPPGTAPRRARPGRDTRAPVPASRLSLPARAHLLSRLRIPQPLLYTVHPRLHARRSSCHRMQRALSLTSLQPTRSRSELDRLEHTALVTERCARP